MSSEEERGLASWGRTVPVRVLGSTPLSLSVDRAAGLVSVEVSGGPVLAFSPAGAVRLTNALADGFDQLRRTLEEDRAEGA